MANYSENALWARRRFFAAYNQITIIVEDEGKENFYTELFQRLVGPSVAIHQVLGVGGKPKVVDRFQQRNPMAVPPELFVVDGDFDEILGISPPTSPHFYRLSKYDIEGFVLEENALCVLAAEQDTAKNATDHAKDLQFTHWISNIVGITLRLAAVAALIMKLGIPSDGFAQSITRHAQGNRTVPDAQSVNDYIQTFKANQTTLGDEDFDQRLTEMLDVMKVLDPNGLRWISGKHILLPLAIKKLNQLSRQQLTTESLAMRLAKQCDFAELDDLRVRIITLA
jgi:hypothetical protein